MAVFTAVGTAVDSYFLPSLAFIVPLIVLIIAGTIQGSISKSRFWVLFLSVLVSQIVSIFLFFLITSKTGGGV